MESLFAREHIHAVTHDPSLRDGTALEEGNATTEPEQAPQDNMEVKTTLNTEKSDRQLGDEDRESDNALYRWADFSRRRDVWVDIFKQVVSNPVVCGIAMGFFLTLTTIGPKYLNPSSPQFVPGLFFIWDTCDWLGACVSPVSLVAMGVWMEKKGRDGALFTLSPTTSFLFMFSKLFLVPFIMVGLAKAFDLNNEAGRAAILIAALPISMASFSLGSNYGIGHKTLSANIALGTLFMLPTILLWNISLDAVGLYPVEETPPP